MSYTPPSSNPWHRPLWRGCLALLLVCGFALKGLTVPDAVDPTQQVSAVDSAHWWATGIQELALTGQRLTADSGSDGGTFTGLPATFSLILIATLLLCVWRFRFTFTSPRRHIHGRPSAPRAPPR